MIRTWVEFGKKMVYGRQAVIRGQKWAKQGLRMLKFNISCAKIRSYQKSIHRHSRSKKKLLIIAV